LWALADAYSSAPTAARPVRQLEDLFAENALSRHPPPSATGAGAPIEKAKTSRKGFSVSQVRSSSRSDDEEEGAPGNDVATGKGAANANTKAKRLVLFFKRGCAV
jgi:hypothetical protein